MISSSKDIISHFSGFPNDTAKAYFFFDQVCAKSDRFFWIVKNSSEKSLLLSLLEFWNEHTESRIPLFHNMDWNTWLMWQKTPSSIFILTLEDFVRPSLPFTHETSQFIKTFSKNSNYSISEITETLSLWGYERNTTANAPSVFAVRGGIIDIFRRGSHSPIRLEFEGNKLASIVDIDGSKSLIECTVPAAELPDQFLKESLITHLRSYDKTSGITIPFHFIISDKEELQEFESWDSIQDFFKDQKQTHFSMFPGGTSQEKMLSFESPPSFHHKISEAQTVLQDMHNNGFTIFVASEDSKKIQTTFSKLDRIRYIPWQKSFESFFLPSDHILLLTDLEIFGSRLKKTSTSKVKKPDWTHELHFGDYVVHIDHGIAKYRGMTTAEIEGISKEYFSLEYASNDRLLVPVDMAHKLDKYIGQAHPKLHRLSGTTWLQLTRKVQKDTLKVAEELLKLYAKRSVKSSIECIPTTNDEEKLISRFDFEETPDQKAAILETLDDLTKDTPTDRLICGDVGFGKTEVAIRAIIRAALCGLQVALLAPTTILAQQHFDTLEERFRGTGLNIHLLSRFQTKKEQQKTVSDLKKGLCDIVIGTHRLLQKDISFKNLGLVIIDEEQRFGVKDKENLKKLRENVHILTLTATPIPRTLHLALSGLREISLITTPPEGRLPIITSITPYGSSVVKKACERELERKGQVYFLYNRVETIEKKAEELRELLPKVRIETAHGQMKEKDLAAVMRRFDHGEIDILVCSTIIENGLDLPNANTLIVDHATNFGLGQLYQLRGRVGRSKRQAYVHFLYHRQRLTGEAKKRLLALKHAQALGSGWQIAKRDLEIRGTGEILGHNQHGKVSSIGLNLYLQLLEHAVTELKTGKPQETYRDISVDLPVSGFLPKGILSSESERIKLYQELASEKSIAKIESSKKRLLKRIHSPKNQEAITNLLYGFELRILAQRTNILSIDTIYKGPEKTPHIILHFMGELDYEKVSELLEKNSKWRWKGLKISIGLHDLDDDWKKELKQVIELFRK